MSSLSSITKAVTGLQAAQKGLQTTGHNISNAQTKGYTRQQLLQSDLSYITSRDKGGYSMQVGLGVSCDEIRQIRDDLADKRLREEKSVLCHYQKLSSVTNDIEAMFDEPYGSTISNFLDNFWSQAQKLSTTPNGVEERLSFISSAKVLVDKINEVDATITDYQYRMNDNLLTAVNRVNEIVTEIGTLNEQIALNEAGGNHANDYRDQRNLLLDELSEYGEIDYYEEKNRMISVSFEGHEVVHGEYAATIKTEKYTHADKSTSPFSNLIWSDTGREVFDLTTVTSSKFANDTGSLKAMMIARGTDIVRGEAERNENQNIEPTTWDDIALNKNMSVDVEGNFFVIPKIQKMLKDFTEELVTVVNDCFNGTGIGDHLGEKGVPVFIYDEAEHAYKANPDLLKNGGYNKLGTVNSVREDGTIDEDKIDNIGDNTLVKEFLYEWQEKRDWYDDETSVTQPYIKRVNLKTYFTELVTDLGSEGSYYGDKAVEKTASVNNIENERMSMGSVSMDEEFSYMLKYQYAYSSSARMITVLDNMLDTLINRM